MYARESFALLKASVNNPNEDKIVQKVVILLYLNKVGPI